MKSVPSWLHRLSLSLSSLLLSVKAACSHCPSRFPLATGRKGTAEDSGPVAKEELALAVAVVERGEPGRD